MVNCYPGDIYFIECNERKDWRRCDRNMMWISQLGSNECFRLLQNGKISRTLFLYFEKLRTISYAEAKSSNFTCFRNVLCRNSYAVLTDTLFECKIDFRNPELV